MKPKVYFIPDCEKESVLKLYNALGKELEGNIAVKVHSGETGNQNFLRPDFYRLKAGYTGRKAGTQKSQSTYCGQC